MKIKSCQLIKCHIQMWFTGFTWLRHWIYWKISITRVRKVNWGQERVQGSEYLPGCKVPWKETTTQHHRASWVLLSVSPETPQTYTTRVSPKINYISFIESGKLEPGMYHWDKHNSLLSSPFQKVNLCYLFDC